MTKKLTKNKWKKIAPLWGVAIATSHAWAGTTDPVAVLTQIKGVVAVSKGQAFIQAHKVMVLSAGDSVLALEGGEATVMYSGGCYERISANTMLTLTADAQCGDGSARMEDVGPLYASALGALPVTPRARSSRHNASSKHSQPALGAVPSKPAETIQAPKVEPPAIPSASTITLPPPVSQLPTAVKPTNASASSNSTVPPNASAPTALVPAAAPPSPNGPVVSVPDVIGADESDPSAAEFSRTGAVSVRAKENKDVKLNPNPAPASGPAASVEGGAGPGRAPLSQGGAGVTQALATISAQETDRTAEQERERQKAVSIPPVIKEPVVPAKETPTTPPVAVTVPSSSAPAARATPTAVPKQAGVVPSTGKESAVDKASRKWQLGLDEQDADDGPQMFTTNE